MQLENKTLKELLELQDQISVLIESKREEEKGNFLKRVNDLAKESGLSHEEVTQLFDKTKRKGVLSPKYRNPDDPTKTWSGHGRKPQWFQDLIDQDKNIDDYLI